MCRSDNGRSGGGGGGGGGGGARSAAANRCAEFCDSLRAFCGRITDFCGKMAASAAETTSVAGGRERSDSFSNDQRRRSVTSSTSTVGVSINSPTRFLLAFAAEFIASLFLILIGCGSWIDFYPDRDPGIVRIAATFAATYAGLSYALRHISGGHINPSVTLAWLAARRMSIGRAIAYIIAQILGAIIGAALLLGLTPYEFRVNLGATTLTVSPEQGFAVELFATFAVTFTALAARDKPKESMRAAAPFVIGLVMLGAELFAIPYTGGSFNSARSFGPAIVKGVWANHWVYWFGPVIGGIGGGLVYDCVFATTASLARVRACVTAGERHRRGSSRTPGVETGAVPEQIALRTHHGSSSMEEINLAEEGKVGKVITPEGKEIADV